MSAEWGPAAWKFLHSVTFAFPENPTLQDQQDAESLFLSLRSMLPCQACREHYESEIALHPPDTRSRQILSRWLVDLHNRVNSRLGKSIVSYSNAESLYSFGQCPSNCNSRVRSLTPRSTSATQTNLNIFMVFVSVIIILALFIRISK
jgi:hypothetical protein